MSHAMPDAGVHSPSPLSLPLLLFPRSPCCHEAMKPEIRRVDNRTFLLGLDEQYRWRMKNHERTELLDCARTLAADLEVKPTVRPVEGYYGEDAELTEYFLLMRELQDLPGERAAEVRETATLERLREVTSSRLFGRRPSGAGLFPAGVDALSEALMATRVDEWSMETLTSRAHGIARDGDDYSLVALAALARDAVVLTALRETVVLYALLVGGGMGGPVPEYVWEVHPELAARAAKFVETFNALFQQDIPAPTAENAKYYFNAANPYKIRGRCVRIGYNDAVAPLLHYHWAINVAGGDLVAEEFWDPEIWTTDRYKEERFPDDYRQSLEGREWARKSQLRREQWEAKQKARENGGPSPEVDA